MQLPTTTTPLVSVLMPTCNRPTLLPDAIRSVVAQTCHEFELLVINDGGGDVEPIVRQFNDPRIRLIDLPLNQGKSCALNTALALSRGELVSVLDDDDRFLPEHLAVCIAALQAHPGVGCVYTDFVRTECTLEEGRYGTMLSSRVVFSRDFDRMLLLHTNYIPHPCAVHRRHLVQASGGYDGELRVLIDWDFLRRLAMVTDFLHISQVTGEYYVPVNATHRLSSLLTTDPERMARSRLRAITRSAPGPRVAGMETIGIILDIRDGRAGLGTSFAELVQTVAIPYHLMVVATPAQRGFTEVIAENSDLGFPRTFIFETDPCAPVGERILQEVACHRFARVHTFSQQWYEDVQRGVLSTREQVRADF